MPFDGTDFRDGPQHGRNPSNDPSGGTFTFLSAALLLLPLSLGSVAALLSCLVGK